jgi:hypothetical protein
MSRTFRKRAKKDFGILLNAAYPDTVELSQKVNVGIEVLEEIKKGEGRFHPKVIRRIIAMVTLPNKVMKIYTTLFPYSSGSRWSKATVRSSFGTRVRLSARR